MVRMSEPERHYAIAVRVRRTVIEAVHVRVPVTGEVVTDDHLDGDKVFAAALRIARDRDHRWLRESEGAIEIHPLQTPSPEARAAPRR
jgi:hypothetical protein